MRARAERETSISSTRSGGGSKVESHVSLPRTWSSCSIHQQLSPSKPLSNSSHWKVMLPRGSMRPYYSVKGRTNSAAPFLLHLFDAYGFQCLGSLTREALSGPQRGGCSCSVYAG